MVGGEGGIVKELVADVGVLEVQVEHRGKGRYEPAHDVLVFLLLQDNAQLEVQFTAVVHELTSQPAAFPPAVIGSIGAENQQQRNHEAQHVVGNGNVLDVAGFGELPVLDLEPGNER